jgi:acylpyruvate hydrolase
MGIVRFSPHGDSPRIGYRFSDQIVDLTVTSASLLGGDDPSVQSVLKRSDELEANQGRLLDERTYQLDTCAFHPPLTPSRLVCLEGCHEQDVIDNGIDPHFEEAGMYTRAWPSCWCAPASSYIGPRATITLPDPVDTAQPGGSVGLVIGQPLSSVDTAADAVLGAIVFGCLTSRGNIPRLEGHRMFDSAFQMGAEIMPASVATDIEIELTVDDKTIEHWTTSDWRFTLNEMVVEASSVVPVQPGDIVLTGDPTRNTHEMKVGETLSVTPPAGIGTETPVTRHGERA